MTGKAIRQGILWMFLGIFPAALDESIRRDESNAPGRPGQEDNRQKHGALDQEDERDHQRRSSAAVTRRRVRRWLVSSSICNGFSSVDGVRTGNAVLEKFNSRVVAGTVGDDSSSSNISVRSS